MKTRILILAAVPSACFCLIGCSSGGVEALPSSGKADGAGLARAVSLDTTPQVLPRNRRKTFSEAPSPLPAPEI